MNTVEERLRAALTAKSDAVRWVDDGLAVPEPQALLLPAPHQRARRRWPAALAAAVILVAVGVTVLAGRGGDTGRPTAAGRAEVPWSQVGPDWTLLVAFDSGSTQSRDLYLASPGGVRYLICRLPAPLFVLQPWTITTGKAILTAEGIEHAANDVLIVDLHTGAQTKTTIGTKFSTIQFATPGLDSLLVTYQSFMQLVSASTGQVLVRYPVTDIYGSALSPDDSQIVTGGFGALTVFDRVSGRRIRTLFAPTELGYCSVLRWVPVSNAILAQCSTRNGKGKPSYLTFSADGRNVPVPEDVPAGWHEIRLAAGTIAYQHDDPGSFEPRDVAFAQVVGFSQLFPIARPAEFEHGSWQLTAVGTDVLLFEQHSGSPTNPDTVQLAAWNPFTGTFTSLIAASHRQPPNFLYTTWQQYLP